MTTCFPMVRLAPTVVLQTAQIARRVEQKSHVNAGPINSLSVNIIGGIPFWYQSASLLGGYPNTAASSSLIRDSVYNTCLPGHLLGGSAELSYCHPILALDFDI